MFVESGVAPFPLDANLATEACHTYQDTKSNLSSKAQTPGHQDTRTPGHQDTRSMPQTPGHQDTKSNALNLPWSGTREPPLGIEPRTFSLQD